MKGLMGFFIILGLSICIPLISSAQEKSTTWEVYFSPNGGCTDAIVRELDKAKGNVLVQAYSFTSCKIAKALLDAHKRGARWRSFLIKARRVISIHRQTSWLILVLVLRFMLEREHRRLYGGRMGFETR